jgi:hypothetical protein
MSGADLGSSVSRGAGFPWGGARGSLTAHSPLQTATLLYPNISIIWDGRICMFAVLLRFNYINFINKRYVLSRMCDWTVAVPQYNKFD